MSLSQSKMSKVGFGLWKIPQDICADAVYEAIKAGYRHLDSACDYGNEVQVGQGIKRAIEEGLCSREDLWITSKLWNTYHAKEHVQQAIERSLTDLQLEYLDLYLIHFPIAQPFVAFDDRYPPEWITDPSAANPKMELAPVPLFETWQGMESLVEKGLTKEIGVCNYNTGLLNDLMAYAKIKPAMLQVESHPYLTQERLMKLAKQYDIQVTAFSPLGALSYLELDMAGAAESVLEQSVVKAAAERLGKTAAQIVLRWGVQRGNAIIPKTSRPERLAENLAIFDFELSQQEMDDINGLNSNRRFNDPGHFCEGAFNTFYPIYD
ncbi:aldo/keto reductase [Paraglaciecola polaris]|uniref:Probable NAD(P)H-dependent D-xylose reductase xyl1 n=3 Tax=Paraglaciecola polaris TaxID=222814 RepID=K6YFY0_9ALTE|nr:aldo/keto reductase [Paraglaciecola polaris]GAC31644.1 probable NAD(P)H-dependent D-xylose reductase xyl1 [Paraglaciecola polaris LMG 21857]|tara:strand:+ start:5532 stop:6497 length:966 start_codon:yes stop_codon:yes gene_type:complete